MKFEAGDRVHVTRLDGEKVDFYATLCDMRKTTVRLTNCTKSRYDNSRVYLPNCVSFWKIKTDYYTLATDEEDMDKPERQSITKAYNKARLKNYEVIEIMQDAPDDKIELDNHYIIEVKEGLYVRNATSNYFFKFTKDINKADVYEYENAALKHAEIVDGRVLNLKRYVEVE
ncbi:hypothetical protein [Mammaliicoccus vitulinus]|uniref:hypothetical protein n=1 Tax=Mammaliicoccus vitulinus TaxID=71237 RepID=UPI003F9BAF51